MPAALKQLYASLEFDIVLTKIASFASSDFGRELIGDLEPIRDDEALGLRMDLVRETLDLLRFDDPFPIHGMQDVREPLHQAGVAGSSLSIEHLLAIAQTLEVSQKIHDYFKLRKQKYPKLSKHLQAVSTYGSLSQSIFKVIDAESGEINDQASGELSRLRKAIRRQQGRVRKKMNEIMSKGKDYLQEAIVTIRDGRMVIPLREEHKGRIPGLIHDRSGTGATLFVEPTAVFDLNNQIRESQLQEQREIARLLTELTGKVRERLDDIEATLAALADLDALYAAARYAIKWDGVVPGLSSGTLHIIKGYHPLLLMKHGGPDEIVPLEVKLEREAPMLIITGPNAGGKTVALKTIGLCALMIQCGLPLLADERSELPRFDQIFVDIGDSQSIEQDLSTFSAHVGRLAEILAKATEKTLVLIDEIGTGTDPAEGAALSTAFLRQLHGISAMTVATTHLGALKAFAHDLPGAENGSMSFDESTLAPTYQFRMGIPGSSYAFEIAMRLGLPQEVIDAAREMVGQEHGKVEGFILDLEHKLNHSKQLLAENEIKRSELEGLTKLYKERFDTLRKEEKKFKRQALQESKQILSRANAVIEKVVKEIRTQKADKETIKQARAEVAAVKQEIDKQLAPIVEPEEAVESPEKGDRAEWMEMKIKGRVVSEADAKGQVTFAAGDMKLKLPLKALRRLQEKKQESRSRLKVSADLPYDITTELDLRGKTMDEAQPVLEKYLDQAYLSGLEQVRIIHGKGTGALAKKVGEYLRKHQKIVDFHHAAWNEGDVGVTVVHLTKS